MPPCPSGLQCCSALVVSVLRSCHVIRYRWRRQGGSLSGMWMDCQTSCSSNNSCHSNDHSVGLTSEPYWWVGGTVCPKAQYLHQLDRQDGSAHQNPLGLLWFSTVREGGTVRAVPGPADTSQDCPWSRPLIQIGSRSNWHLLIQSMFVHVCIKLPLLLADL